MTTGERVRVVGRVADHLAAVRAGHTLRVAVDGITAAGKTTFADDLAKALAARDVPVIRVSGDGFHHVRARRYRRGRADPDGYYEDAYDFEAMARVLLDPLGPGGDGRYAGAVHDLATDAVLEPSWQVAARGAVLLVDGSFLQRDLAGRWDQVVFLQAEEDDARTRGVPRDQELMGGPEAADQLFRTRYHPACARYLREVRPAERATVLIGVKDPDRPDLRRIGGRAGGTVRVFSYGTLQQADVQLATFGRRLAGVPAAVPGHRTEWLTITDPQVVATSGSDRHPVVRATGNPADRVAGTVLELTTEELAASDLYEVDDYCRRSVDLDGGGRAWTYLAA